MSDLHNNNTQNDDNESFADLLESYSLERKEEVLIGDKISGEIISISRDKVFVDTGTKIDGIVEKTELLDENGEISFEIGDKIDLYVVAVGENKIELSRGFSGVGGMMHLREAYQQSIPVEGKVESQCKGGFNVMVMGKRAFCPISQIDVKYVENPEQYIGNTYFFLISELEDNGRNIVLTRREMLKKEIEAAAESFYSQATIGTVLEGQVTRITSYGVFVELQPNIEGMVHISELSWSKLDQPEDLLKIGDRIRARLIGIEKGDKATNLKISLSIKQVTDNPWNQADQKFKVGDKVRGKVTRCMNFGAFVEIAPGIEGLVHISELSYTKRILHPEDVVKSGDSVSVMIKEIDLDNKRISLSLRDAQGDPWLEVPEKYPIGKSMRGTVERKEKFGLFISLEPGITGLMPKSKMTNSYDASAIDKLRPGDTLTVVVEEIKLQERRMTLAPGDSKDMDDWQNYSENGKSSLGELGEKLQAALKAKK